MSGLAMNDVMPHGTAGRAKAHRARGVICPVCMPTEERPVCCPVCRQLRTAVGDRMVAHDVGGRGWRFPSGPCAGSGVEVPAEPVEDQPLLTAAYRAARERYAAVLDGGAA